MSLLDFLNKPIKLPRFRKKSSHSARPLVGQHNGSAWRTIHEPFSGAWQHNQEIEVCRHDQLHHYAVFACVTLITQDVGKLKLQAKKTTDGVRIVTKSKLDALIARPNKHQTAQQFFENWITSKVTYGNAYIWVIRDIYGNPWQMVVLNPERVTPLIDPHGNVFYRVSRDNLWDIEDNLIIPSEEIIHDRYNCLYHPLVGLSPIVACALSASNGVNIERNASLFFANASRPSGILTAPQAISESTASEIRNNWNRNYSGSGTGKTAVLGDGMTYTPIAVSASDSQMVEQAKLSSEKICTAFKIPPYKVGLGAIPAGQKVGDLNEIYYSDCLQHYIEAIENLLKYHLDWGRGVEPEFNLKGLIRMDSTSQIDYLTKAVGGAIMSPNEARAELGLQAVEGGNSPMIQQQNYSLEAIGKRDNLENPFSKEQSNDSNNNANESATTDSDELGDT